MGWPDRPPLGGERRDRYLSALYYAPSCEKVADHGQPEGECGACLASRLATAYNEGALRTAWRVLVAVSIE